MGEPTAFVSGQCRLSFEVLEFAIAGWLLCWGAGRFRFGGGGSAHWRENAQLRAGSLMAL